jgi:TolA-binding protein
MTSPCPEDLLGLRRAGQLSATDARLLETHLRACTACALDESLHESFAHAGCAQARDDEVIARAVDRTMAKRRGRARWSWSLAAGMAALVMVAGLASAAVWLRGRAGTRPQAETVSAPVAQPSTPVSPASTAAPELAAPEPAAVPIEPPRTATVRTRPHRRPALSDEPPATPAPDRGLDLKALFAAANEARRAGELDRAGELYSELQRRFPVSREAQLSLVSYGRILLDRGRAAEALAQFERHIQAAAGGVLAAEAFYGQARALTSLHREAEARQGWADLLARFPDSIYADVARSHLGAK